MYEKLWQFNILNIYYIMMHDENYQQESWKLKWGIRIGQGRDGQTKEESLLKQKTITNTLQLSEYHYLSWILH